MEKRALKCLSIADKIKLIRAVDEGNQKKKEIAKHFEKSRQNSAE
jgi:hypothetical protein